MKQAIISSALDRIGGAYIDSSGELILNGTISCSCPALSMAIGKYCYGNLDYFNIVHDSIMQEYRELSGALERTAGFKGITLSQDIAQRQAYRQEMLYYFWMANQEM